MEKEVRKSMKGRKDEPRVKVEGQGEKNKRGDKGGGGGEFALCT